MLHFCVVNPKALAMRGLFCVVRKNIKHFPSDTNVHSANTLRRTQTSTQQTLSVGHKRPPSKHFPSDTNVHLANTFRQTQTSTQRTLYVGHKRSPSNYFASDTKYSVVIIFEKAGAVKEIICGCDLHNSKNVI